MLLLRQCLSLFEMKVTEVKKTHTPGLQGSPWLKETTPTCIPISKATLAKLKSSVCVCVDVCQCDKGQGWKLNSEPGQWFIPLRGELDFKEHVLTGEGERKWTQGQVRSSKAHNQQ